jgi:hypothetical protein
MVCYNLFDHRHLAPLLDAKPNIQILLESRTGYVPTIMGTAPDQWSHIHLDLFNDDEATDLLGRMIPQFTHDECLALADSVGRLPLAVQWVGTLYLRWSPNPGQVAKRDSRP